MNGLKHSLLAALGTAAIAIAPLSPANAGGHGLGLVHPWGLARGVVGTVAAIATLPLVIASAVLSGGVPVETEAPAYGAPQGYYPAPGYYARPPTYYSPAPYYGGSPSYGPRSYYGASGGYAQPGRYPSRGYAPGRGGYHGTHGGSVPSRSGEYGYRR